MSNHIQSVANALNELEIKFKTEEAGLILPFGGDTEFVVFVNTQVDGNVLNFEARGFIDTAEVQNSEHRAAFALYLLHRNFITASGSFEMDNDGEVRLAFEVPMADAQVTVKQVALIMHLLKDQIRNVLDGGKEILRTGKLPIESRSGGDSAMAEMGKLIELHQQMTSMAQNKQGLEALAQIAADENMPAQVRSLAQMVLAKAMPDEL